MVEQGCRIPVREHMKISNSKCDDYIRPDGQSNSATFQEIHNADDKGQCPPRICHTIEELDNYYKSDKH